MRTGSPGITVYPFEDSPNKLFPSSKGIGIGADDLPLLFSSLIVEQTQAASKPVQFQSQWSSAFGNDSSAGDRNGMSVWGLSAVH